MFSVYSLNDVAETVARVLRTGEKNALRKTYKGQIKKLGLSGKFDVEVNSQAEQGGGLSAMVFEPEEEWAVQNSRAKDIGSGLSELVRSSMSKSMTMAKGVIPKSRWDSSVLGDLDLPDKKSVAAAPTKMPGAAQKTSAAPVQRPNKAELPRPKRNVKKRHYEDSSFEGYGEGFVDDDVMDGGYSTGDGDEMSQKRRKKVCYLLAGLANITNIWTVCQWQPPIYRDHATEQLWPRYGWSVKVGKNY